MSFVDVTSTLSQWTEMSWTKECWSWRISMCNIFPAKFVAQSFPVIILFTNTRKCGTQLRWNKMIWKLATSSNKIFVNSNNNFEKMFSINFLVPFYSAVFVINHEKILYSYKRAQNIFSWKSIIESNVKVTEWKEASTKLLLINKKTVLYSPAWLLSSSSEESLFWLSEVTFLVSLPALSGFFFAVSFSLKY